MPPGPTVCAQKQSRPAGRLEGPASEEKPIARSLFFGLLMAHTSCSDRADMSCAPHMPSDPFQHTRAQIAEADACARRWEVLTCLLPWGNCSPWQVVINVTKRGKRPEIPPAEELVGPPLDRASMSCYMALMQRCWAGDPAERPAFSEVASALRCASARSLPGT